MENHFCEIHGCQLEEREHKEPHKMGQIYYVCTICEENETNDSNPCDMYSSDREKDSPAG